MTDAISNGSQQYEKPVIEDSVDVTALLTKGGKGGSGHGGHS